MLTRQLNSDPMGAIRTIRFRPSKGGRPWARPEALPIQVQNARAQATLRDGAPLAATHHQCTISITELPTGMPDDLLQVIVQHATDTLGVPLQRNRDFNAMRANDWQPFQDPLGRWAGRLLVQCSSQQEVWTLQDKLHGSCIERNGTPCILEVNNPHATPHKTLEPDERVGRAANMGTPSTATTVHPLGLATSAQGEG